MAKIFKFLFLFTPGFTPFILFLLFSPAVFSQRVNLHNYTEDDGLASSKVVCLHQDRNGFLWVGTTEGLSKFDGNSFTNYKILEGLKSNFIYKIIEDIGGNIWFETYEGITMFDGKTFKNFNVHLDLLSEDILDFAADHAGNIWIATNRGIAVFNGEKFKYFWEKEELTTNIRKLFIDNQGNIWFIDKNEGLFKFVDNSFVNISGMSGKKESINNIYEDSNKNIWLISKDSATISKYNGTTFTEYSPEQKKGVEFFEIIEDPDNNIWITSNHGLYKFDGKGFTNFNEVKDAEIKSISKDKEGNLWFSTSNNFIIKYDGKNFSRIGHDDGLITNLENCIIEDREGNIWIGTYGFGLYKYSVDIFSFEDRNLNINSERINCIIQDKKGNIWFGTSNQGVFKYDGSKVENYTTLNGLGSNIIYSMYEDKAGNIWIGCVGGALTRYDGKTFYSYLYDDGYQTFYKYAITQDKDLNIWLGTFQGIYKFDSNKNNPFSKRAGLKNDYIKTILRDSKNNIWVGTFGGGLSKYNGVTFTNYGIPDGLTSNFIYSLIEDEFGNIWAGTDTGINVIKILPNGKIQKVDVINYKDGLSNDIIVSMTFDNFKDLWIGTFGGINKLFTKEYYKSGKKQIKSFGFEDGLKGIKCIDNSILNDRNGDVWFGTSKGIIKWKVNKYKKNRIEPLTHITQVRLFYEEFDYAAFGAKLDPVTFLPADLKLPSDKNYLTFDFLSLCLTNAKLVRYQYKLEGFDQDWLPVTEERFATYSNLPPGNYQFMVIACNNDGVWNHDPTTFSFTVTPPFWKTVPFIGFAIVLCGGIIYSLAYWRIRQLKIKQEQKTELNKELAKMELKALRAQMNPHFIFNSLNSIQLYISRNDKELANKYLSNFSKLIRMTLENSVKSSISIFEELEQLKLYLELETLRLGNKLTYEIKVGDGINIYELEMPNMLIQPFVENAIWHGIANKPTGGKVTVELNKNHEYLIWSVMDDGIGRAKSKELRNAMSYQNKSKGMSVTTERLQLLNSLNKQNATINVVDLVDSNNEPLGTKLEIFISLEYLKYD